METWWSRHPQRGAAQTIPGRVEGLNREEIKDLPVQTVDEHCPTTPRAGQPAEPYSHSTRSACAGSAEQADPGAHGRHAQELLDTGSVN
jgi:hypothetical protein